MRIRIIRYNLRYPGMVSLMLERIIGGKNWIGRPKQSYEIQITKYTGCKLYSEMKRLALEKREVKSCSKLIVERIS